MKRLIFGLFFMLLSVAIVIPAIKIQLAKAEPTTITVPDDYPTIQAAINAANAGDTVYVRNGIYQEHIEIDKTITLIGESNQNTIIEADSFGGVGINVAASDVTVENFNITSGVGPLGSGVICVNGFSDDVIKNNYISSAANIVCDTFDILSSSGNIVEDNQIIVGNPASSGIGVISDDNTIFNNTVLGGWLSIGVIVGNDNNISNNYVSGQTLSAGYSDIGAICLLATSGDAVVGNTLINNQLGLSVAFGTGCSVYHNNFINNTQQALTENGSQVLFDDGYPPGGGNYWSDYQTKYPNAIENDSSGIWNTPYVIDANDTDNYPLMNPYTVLTQLQAAQTVYINSDGSVSPSSAPISTVDNATYTFTGDISYPAYNGIVVERSNITVDGAGYTLQGLEGTGSGIYSEGTNNIAIKNTNFMDCGTCIEFDYSSNILISGNNMTSSGSCGVSLFNSSNADISDNNINNSGSQGLSQGISLFLSSSSTVSGNNVTSSSDGVDLTYSFDNVLSENNIAGNVWYGVEFQESSNNVVSNNKIDGIALFTSTFNAISNNIIARANILGQGVGLYYSSNNNTLTGNNITNALPGVRIALSSYNEIFHNNFIDNIPQVISETSLNFWDNGYPSGGNYWSDYNGTDTYSGPHQNAPGSDGIGDTPYVIDANNTDHYPLMNPWTGYPVAVTAVAPDCKSVYQGGTANISVTVQNTGDIPENVWVTLYYNMTANKIIDAFPVHLDTGQSYTLLFTWNTAGVPCLNYTLTALAALATLPIYYTAVSNANLTVRLSGDVNGDGRVDMKDIAIVARALGSTPTSPNWNPAADINGDGTVNMRDIALVARNFGQHYP